jgi:predicted alpha/beta hydrolase family esterase
MPMRRWLMWFVLGLVGCAQTQTFRADRGIEELAAQGFRTVETPVHIKAWLKDSASDRRELSARVLHVFVEGDGAAWWSQQWPPADPTPRISVALPMALSDPHPGVAYLARPCQYLTAAHRSSCPVAWWTNERWSEAVIVLTAQALDQLVRVSGASELVLIGHSGGGNLALLAASRRHDVRCVVTLAAPLDIQAWVTGHGLAPVKGSLSPVDLPSPSGSFQEHHLLGLDDRIVPPSAHGRYALRLRPDQVVRVSQQGHTQGWVQRWYKPVADQAPLSESLSDCLGTI